MPTNEVNKVYLDIYNKTHLKYLNIENYIQKYNGLDYNFFSEQVFSEASLFSQGLDIDFDLLERNINEINNSRGAIKRIFSKPLLHLKEEAVVVAAEAVRHINKDTIQHISTHSELWDNVSANNIKPTKLLTRNYQDDYSIYENLIFCDTIDKILNFLRTNLRILKDLVITKQSIEVNILDRVHHIQYFLALGKLYTGYIKFFDLYYGVVEEYHKEIEHIYSIIKARLNRPVYKNNQNFKKNLKIRKTNILAMHKDYHKIYNLHRFLDNKDANGVRIISEEDLQSFKKNYFNFIVLLSIFSITHFNYYIKRDTTLNFRNLDLIAEFKSWVLHLKNYNIEDYDVLEVNIKKDKAKKIIIIPVVFFSNKREDINQKVINKIKQSIDADEYIICTPYEYDDDIDGEIYLSNSNVDSFRRIQQVLLKYMIYVDNKRLECPFCTNSLSNISDSNVGEEKTYLCKSCRTIICDTICPDTNNHYTYTEIANMKLKSLNINNYNEDEIWLYYRDLESNMYFRNIKKINSLGENICPYCNQVHKMNH